MAVDIRAILPHRYPFLLVDRFVSQTGDSFECIKNVTHNEPFFVGHFPDEPVMPGVLIVEALAQASAVGLAVREGQASGNGAVGYLTTVDGAKFRRRVVPGDQLRLTGTITLFRRGICRVEARALVGEDVAAEATLSFIYAR
ncbi:MAG: 3-hydroxyacyl-ACP dehydratase FabZ [Trueperaceae bacterium]